MVRSKSYSSLRKTCWNSTFTHITQSYFCCVNNIDFSRDIIHFFIQLSEIEANPKGIEFDQAQTDNIVFGKSFKLNDNQIIFFLLFTYETYLKKYNFLIINNKNIPESPKIKSVKLLETDIWRPEWMAVTIINDWISFVCKNTKTGNYKIIFIANGQTEFLNMNF